MCICASGSIMSTNMRYVRPTRASNLRALANNSRAASNELTARSQSPSGFSLSRSVYTAHTVYSMPTEGRFSASYFVSLHEQPTKAERSVSKSRTNSSAAKSRALPKAQVRSVGTQSLQTESIVESKLVTNDDTKSASSRLAHNLPNECVQDLKARCQAAVDSGFMMLYDHLEPIQLAKDEFEACHRKEQLKVKLKELLSRNMERIVESIDEVCGTAGAGEQKASPNSHLYSDIGRLRRLKQHMEGRFLQLNKNHIEQMNRLRADLEGKLLAGERHWQQTLGELQERLRHSETHSEETSCQLAMQNAALTAKDSAIESAKANMDKLSSRNMELKQLVKESDAALLSIRQELERNREHIACLEGQLNELKQRPAAVDILPVVQEKDQIISELKLKIEELLLLKDVHHDQEQTNLKLCAKNDELDAKISELQAKLNSTKAQPNDKDQKDEQLHLDQEFLRQELFCFQALVIKLREQASRYSEVVTTCTHEITELKKTIDQRYLESVGKDTQIKLLSNQLRAKEEQVGQLFEKLNCQQEKLMRLEECVKLSAGNTERHHQ
ncbi:putative leucine-rich repeat-containing protein DDB_G0290503 [Drosophila guanche]|uniref:Blast:Putative leucine-rich repeat-containing protein DDB_G0290503 n=2 Tax=Drosophila guanche TaxID=7266 RepID=A0A3B0JSN2_DROGU|nr:putative leucine-rich repeat-containing protein DDB_G0290503 [Drosophila guanche]SPP78480.1 blast:Putative leucine-rich repeat-containing protein DDB_G0290503 [Drosophila guanche]